MKFLIYFFIIENLVAQGNLKETLEKIEKELLRQKRSNGGSYEDENQQNVAQPAVNQNPAETTQQKESRRQEPVVAGNIPKSTSG